MMGTSFSSIFLGWEDLDIEDADELPLPGMFFKVKMMQSAGISTNRDRVEHLFSRKETHLLWKTLSKWNVPPQDDRTIIGVVQGAPGTGKSATTLCWLQKHVKSTGRSATWFHVTDKFHVYRVDMSCKKDVLSYKTTKQYFNFLPFWIMQCSSTVLVLDGYREISEFTNICSAIQLWAGKRQGQVTAILVSSYAFSIKLQDMVQGEYRWEIFENESWALDEYRAAFKHPCPDDNFGSLVSNKRRRIQSEPSDEDRISGSEPTDNNVSPSEGPSVTAVASNHNQACSDEEEEEFQQSLDNSITPSVEPSVTDVDSNHEQTVSDEEELAKDIDAKFFYAGHCARYFFGFSIEEIKKEVRGVIEQLSKTSIDALLESGSKNQLESRHRLLAFFKDEYDISCKSIVSQFAVQCLCEKYGASSFPFLYELGRGNPSFDGWVFEADFFFQYKQAKARKEKFVLHNSDSTVTMEMKSNPMATFDHGTMLGKSKESEDTQNLKQQLQFGTPKMWKPLKWNQGGYDGFYVFADPEAQDSCIIWFFQVTRGASHKLRLKYFVEVIQLFLDAGFKVSKFKIYFVVPEGNTCTVPDVIPHGKLVYNRFGWRKRGERDMITFLEMKKTGVALA